MPYCLDTDVISALMLLRPPVHLIRRIGLLDRDQQSTTAVNLGELLYGASKRGNEGMVRRIEQLVRRAGAVHPFDAPAARIYAALRAQLEAEGRRLDEPDLRIAAIALVHDLTLITGQVKHFSRVHGLRVENWLEK